MSSSLFGVDEILNAKVNGTIVPQSFSGTAGQTTFNLTAFTYTPNTGSIQVYINGTLQNSGRDYSETSNSSFVLSEGVLAGDFVDVIGLPQTTTTANTAGSVILAGSYTLSQYILDQGVNVKAPPYLAQGNGVADDTASFKLAIATGAGADFGYGQIPFAVIIPSGTYVINQNITLPVNCSLICHSQAIFIGTGSITVQNPALAAGSHTYTQYFPYMNCVLRGINFQVPLINNCFIQLRLENCVLNGLTFDGLTLNNTGGLWTERTSLIGCTLNFGTGFSAITCNGNNGIAAQQSVAYISLSSCVVSGSGSGKLFNIINGAKFYGAHVDVRGNAKDTCTLFYMNASFINDCVFNVSVEDDTGAGTPVLFNVTGGQFWNNKGWCNHPSYNYSNVEGGGTSFRSNYIVVSGVTWKDYWGGGSVVSNAPAYTVVITNDLIKCKPVDLQFVDFRFPGTMSSAINATAVNVNQLAGVLPANINRIFRTEITARLPPGSGVANPSGKWFFDIRKGMDAASFQYLGTTTIFLADGSMSSDQAQDLTFAYTQPLFMANPTDTPATVNTGTGPTDVSVRVYFN